METTLPELAPDVLLVDLLWFPLVHFLHELPGRKVFLWQQLDPGFFVIPLPGGDLSFDPAEYDLVVAGAHQAEGMQRYLAALRGVGRRELGGAVERALGRCGLTAVAGRLLRKRFGDLIVLRGIDLTVAAGEDREVRVMVADVSEREGAEEALKAVTLYPAEILGVADRLGSLQVGKEATLIVTDGDPLDIRSHVVRAFIAGREIDLSSRHTRLYEKYRDRSAR